jgi:hypothetical protein
VQRALSAIEPICLMGPSHIPVAPSKTSLASRGNCRSASALEIHLVGLRAAMLRGFIGSSNFGSAGGGTPEAEAQPAAPLGKLLRKQVGRTRYVRPLPANPEQAHSLQWSEDNVPSSFTAA